MDCRVEPGNDDEVDMFCSLCGGAVEQGTHSSSSTRIGNQMGFGLFERSYRHVAGDGREVVKESVQRMAALDVVDQRLDGDARSDKHRGAAQDVRVGVYNGGFFHRLCLRPLRSTQ